MFTWSKKLVGNFFVCFTTLKDHKNQQIENEHENRARHGFSDIQTCTNLQIAYCLKQIATILSISTNNSVRLSVCPSVRLSVCPSVRLSVCSSVRLSVCLSVCPSVRLSVYPSVRLSVCPSVRLSVCSFIRLFIQQYFLENDILQKQIPKVQIQTNFQILFLNLNKTIKRAMTLNGNK